MELYSVKREKRQIMFLAGVFMGTMAVGIYLSFCDVFAYPKNYRDIYLAVVIFSLIFTLTGMCSNILKNILYIGYTAAFGIYALLKTDYLQENINVLLAYIMVKKQEYTSGDDLNISDVLGNLQSESSGKAAVIIIIGILILIMAVCIFSLKSRTWSCFPTVAIIALGLMYGKTPSVKSCILIVASAVGIIFSITNRKMGKKNKVVGYVIMFAVMAFCMITAEFTEQMTKEKILSKNAEVLKRQHGYENTIKNIALNIVEDIQNKSSSGRMTNISPVYTGKNIFSVTLDKRPKSNIYFKEFSADTYKDNRWTSSADDSEFYSYRLRNIFSYGYKSVNLISDGKDNFVHMNMQIKYENEVKNGGEKLSLPYFSDLLHINTNRSSDGKSSQIFDNGIKLNDSERSITRKADRYYIKYYDMSLEKYNVLLNRENGIINDVNYWKYVENNYLAIPEDGRLRAFAENIKFSEKTGLQCNLIRKALQSDTEYTTNPGTLPFGKDYLDYFLFENKKGYCEHFATASTLLLRLKDIPARYAAGYMVSPSQFEMLVKKNDRGKVVKKYYVAYVHDNDAHAWSEVYKEGVGWIPVDMTKSSAYSENEDNIKNTAEPTENSNLQKDNNKNDINHTNTKIPQSDNKKGNISKDKKDVADKKNMSGNNDNKNDKSQNKDSIADKNKLDKDVKGKSSEKVRIEIPNYVKIIVLIVLAVVMFGVYMLFVRQKLFNLSYRRAIRKADGNSEILLVSRRYMARYMGAYGRRLEKLSDDEYMEGLSEICDIKNLGDIFQRAAFSKNDISDEELFYGIEIMNQIGLNIRMKEPLHYLNFELNLLQNFIIEKTK